MDRSLLPDIFALTVFIAAFRPLARRVGPHANIWFLGWGFLLLNHVAELFTPQNLTAQTALDLAATWTLDLCGLVFVIVSGNVPKRLISRRMMAALSVPVLLQSGLTVLHVVHPAVQIAACLLFLAPAVQLMLRPRERARLMFWVCGSFAMAGLGMVPIVALHRPVVASQGAFALLFLCAGYLYFCSAERATRGVIAGSIGLMAWGLSYPVVDLFHRFFRGLRWFERSWSCRNTLSPQA